jgi:hypothetical protein
MTPEGRVKEGIKRVLKKYDVWYFMPAANGFGKQGVSDFICCWDGQFLAIEAKAPGKEKDTTPNQERFISEVKLNGGWAFVCDDPAALDNWLRLQRTVTCLMK